MKRQFVTTAYIVWDNQLLLLLHPKFHKWLSPGGHLEENETPVESVLREVIEETGFEVEIISDKKITINQPTATSLEQPFITLLENIPATKKEEAHQHIDLAFLAKPIQPNPNPISPEGHQIKWFTLDELYSIEEGKIFPETIQIAETLLAPQVITSGS